MAAAEAAFVEPPLVETAPVAVTALVTLEVVAAPVRAGAAPVPPEKESVWVRQLGEAILCVRRFRSAGIL